MVRECSICYFPVEFKSIKCCNTQCNSEICLECLDSYINFYFNENKGIPKCPSLNCKDGEILLSEVEKTGNSVLINKYNELVINHFKKDNLEDIIAESNQKILIEKIRKERHDYVSKEFPKAISFVIEKSLKNKLKRIDKVNSEYIKSIKKKNNKKCPNILCYSGILDINYTCLTCSQHFCKTCENKLKEDEKHECKQEDIDSIKVIENFVKCPSCKLPVVKSFGCNNITCSICKINFDYKTGSLTSHGNHSNDTLVLKNFDSLSLILQNDGFDDIIILNYLRRIENNEPENYSFNNILTPLKKYISIENSEISNYNDLKNLAQFISRNYELYKKRKYKKKEYYKIIEMIREKYDNKELTKDFIQKMSMLIY
jgi:hypothetical protein